MKTYTIQLRKKGTSERQTIELEANSKNHAFNLAWKYFEGHLFAELNEIGKNSESMQIMRKQFPGMEHQYSVPCSGVSIK